MNKLFSTAAVALIGSTEAKFHHGGCPHVEYMQTFDKKAYVGEWYEIFRDRHNMYTHHAECVTKEFDVNDEGAVDLYFRGLYDSHWWHGYHGVQGTMYNCGKSEHPNDWTCQATMGSHSKHLNPIKVFDTDYENYEISYGCWSFHGLFSFSNLAISSRETEMSTEMQAKVRAVIEEKLPHYHMDHGMHWTKQGEDQCDYEWKFGPNANWVSDNKSGRFGY